MKTSGACLAVVFVLLASPVFGQLRSMDTIVAQKKVAQAPPKGPERYATCQEATGKVPGYTFAREALQHCPDLQALQRDPNAAITFFVPSDKAIKNMATANHLPVQLLNSGRFKSLMCSVLQYHVVDGVHLKKEWAVGQKLATRYKGQELTVSAIGQAPQVATTTGVQANVKRVVFCGKSVVFGTDAVLTPSSCQSWVTDVGDYDNDRL